ncbi:MAG: hypothetical protein ACKOUR_04260, partial [Planctomycetota bacterium]
MITDLPDYAPGNTAVISAWNDDSPGTNFDAGEQVKFQVTRTDGIPDQANGNLPWYATDGVGGFDGYYVDSNNDGDFDYGIFPDTDGTENGSVGTTWFVEQQYADSTLLLTATGMDSGAVATHEFTDAAASASITFPANGGTYDSATWVDVISGSRNFTGSVGTRSMGVAVQNLTTSQYWNGSSFASATVIYNSTTTGNTDNGNSNWTYNFPDTNLSSGSYTVTFKATDTSGTSSATATATFTYTAAAGTGNLVVNAQSGTATYGAPTDNVTFFVDETRSAIGTFNGSYSVTGLPSGVTSSFSPSSFTSSGNTAFGVGQDSTLTVTVDGSVNAGSYPFTVL